MLTQENYAIFTNQQICYADTVWETIVSIAQKRLASFLCLEEFPELTDDNQDLAMLLANFIAATLKFAGATDLIESKQVRNFTINFKNSATNAFGQIYKQYEDIIDTYSRCGTEINVEKSIHHCCGGFPGGYNGFVNF